MKKTILIAAAAIVAALTLAAVLSGCSGVKDSAYPRNPAYTRVTALTYPKETTLPPVTEADTDAPTGEISPVKTVKFSGGVSVTLGGIAEDELEKCGDALSVSEAPSCVYDGVDKVYSYLGFNVTTSPDGTGYDRVASVEIVSSDAVLEGGITVGSSIGDVIALYGDDFTESFGMYTFENDGAVMTVVADGDTVTSIAFSLS